MSSIQTEMSDAAIDRVMYKTTMAAQAKNWIFAQWMQTPIIERLADLEDKN